jgi:predicted lipoprotein
MRYTKFLLVVLFLSSIGISQSCRKTEVAEYNRLLLTQELIEHVILPRYEDFLDEVVYLQSIVNVFADNLDIDNYMLMTKKWLDAKKAYKLIELYNVGDVYDTYAYNKLNKWPCNTVFIDDMLASTETLNQSYVDTKGSTAKGLAAMEYLLYDPSLSIFESHQRLTTSADSERRISLLQAYAEDLYFKAYFLNDFWSESGDNYGQTFVINAPILGLQSPLNIIANAMLAQAERVYTSELGQPLGNYNGGVTDATKAEAFRSKESLVCILGAIDALEEAFVGHTIGNGTGMYPPISIKHHLIACDAAETVNDIHSNLNEARTILNTYQGSLEYGLESNPEPLNECRQYIKNIVVLLKTEVFPALGITVTFNDNDGD